MIATQCSKCGAHNAMDIPEVFLEKARDIDVAGLCRYCAFRAGKGHQKSIVTDAAKQLKKTGVMTIWHAAHHLLEQVPAPNSPEDDAPVTINSSMLRAMAKMACIGCFTVFEATEE